MKKYLIVFLFVIMASSGLFAQTIDNGKGKRMVKQTGPVSCASYCPAYAIKQFEFRQDEMLNLSIKQLNFKSQSAQT